MGFIELLCDAPYNERKNTAAFSNLKEKKKLAIPILHHCFHRHQWNNPDLPLSVYKRRNETLDCYSCFSKIQMGPCCAGFFLFSRFPSPPPPFLFSL